MLVKIESGAELSAAEREFVECLRKLPTTGVALIDLQVGPDSGKRQVDAVVWTPRGVTVLEARGFRRRQSGILEAGGGRWTISSQPADLEQPEGVDLSDQLEHAVHEVKTALERSLQDPGHLCGAVVLLPWRGAVVRPARTTLRPGLDVVVANAADTTEFRIYLENFAAGPRAWTADRVLAAASALIRDSGSDILLSREELLAEGFDTAAPTPKPIPARPAPRREPTPENSGRQTAAAWVVLTVGVLGTLVVLGVIMRAVLTDGPDVEPTATTTTGATATPQSRATVPAVPVGGGIASPRASVECWPFQAGC
ncbi:NERD domain-containing protein [Nocardia cyriacigeorgica]|uniref:nuclease-related domain-containing protein n=1 Tax=Nocardia cyriacigeorgica TaxID=135487 RepID=UPI00189348BF|nr:nuclease-related domain-containing protein [Nocardia cyriacigeorgica]MBF6316006.1 NERD domain-containing protein [Nocardia cyriacigeorgica]MBF6515201.1 NERD domain-containing protein [Nocardia cyriacigeorgica]MBF6530791.1 NERD domain-containing protein [Nocardia cyriacigeorgica]